MQVAACDAADRGALAGVLAGVPSGHRLTMAVHAADILHSAQRHDSLGDALADCSLAVGTTCRPGLYRSGYGGVRLEDIAIVTEDGVDVVTDYPYDLEP